MTRKFECDVVTIDPSKQWRIDNAKHFRGLQLQFRKYTRWNDTWDHDHCEACMVTLAEIEGEDFQHEGYATCDDYKRGALYGWVCCTCFDELKNEMAWSIATK